MTVIWLSRLRRRSRANSEADGQREMIVETLGMKELLHRVAKRVNTNCSNPIATFRVMSTRGERLKAARSKLFPSARAAALSMGVAVSTYNAHERAEMPGGRDFSYDEAERYGRHLGVSAMWLMTGADAVAKSVPLISWVSAGTLQSPESVEDIRSASHLSVGGLPPGEWVALEVVGSSMDRISPPGSVIVVNLRDKKLVPNACYVIQMDGGEATYKRFRPNPDRFEPVSTSAEHEPIFPEGPVTVLGRVRKSMIDM